MILYHGSIVEVKDPKIIKSDIGRDFGFAFYTTTIEEQAAKMALKKKFQNMNNNPDCKAIVSVYEWNEDISSLKYKEFPHADNEWIDMILLCRKNRFYKHGFDIVKGKIADDRVGLTIDIYLGGVLSKESLIKELQYQKINDQIAFCSEKSLEGLKFIKSYEVK